MANRTIKDAISIKGVNPQYLVEKIIRTRIYDSRYWKEECFALTAELLVDKAMEIKSIGGVYGGNVKPSPFICLILKMLQIQPEKDIIIEFIRNEDFKYVRALGAIYMRLTGTSLDIYKYLEPLYIDYRKMKRMNKSAKYELIHMDEFIDELLNSERVCDIALPRIQKRQVLEESNELEPRISALDVDLDDIETSSEEDDENDDDSSSVEDGEENDSDEDRRNKHSRSSKSNKKQKSRSRTRSRSRSRDRRRSDSRDRHVRRKYVDYDNPNPEDEMPRFKRTPSPSRTHHNKKSSRRRSRSRSHSPTSKKSSSSKHRDRDRSREREKERNRDRDRDRERKKKSRSRSKERSKHKKSSHRRGGSSGSE